MIRQTFAVGPLMCNCSILADEKTGEAIVIDPGGDSEKILDILSKNNWQVRYILHTHAHIDHVGATYEIKQKQGGQVGLNKDDFYLYNNLKMQAELLRLPEAPKAPPIEIELEEGQVLEWGKNRMQVLHTPGHTPGSVCFEVNCTNERLIFSGDTLFRGSIGRTDLWGGDFGQIQASIKEKIFAKQEDATVICGHGPNTSLAFEAQNNPFL